MGRTLQEQASTDPAGSPLPLAPTFDQRVYAMVARIPEGQLATYGQIAELIGAWGCARQVGWALRRLPLPSDLPWHRVVNAQGRVSLSLAREGSDWIQAELLRAEGITVDGEGQLSLHRHRWRGPESARPLPPLDGPSALPPPSLPDPARRARSPRR